MAEPMRLRATLKDGMVNVKVLMSHDMENGLRKDTAGKLIPAHYITQVTVSCAGKVVLSAQWGPSVSRNPFLEFNFRGGQKGDKVQISWIDNRGDKRSDEVAVN